MKKHKKSMKNSTLIVIILAFTLIFFALIYGFSLLKNGNADEIFAILKGVFAD